MVLASLIAALILALIVGRDTLRGSTSFGGTAITRKQAPRRHWAIVVFYAGGAAFLVYLAGEQVRRELGCEPGAEECVYVLEPVEEP